MYIYIYFIGRYRFKQNKNTTHTETPPTNPAKKKHPFHIISGERNCHQSYGQAKGLWVWLIYGNSLHSFWCVSLKVEQNWHTWERRDLSEGRFSMRSQQIRNQGRDHKRWKSIQSIESGETQDLRLIFCGLFWQQVFYVFTFCCCGQRFPLKSTTE